MDYLEFLEGNSIQVNAESSETIHMAIALDKSFEGRLNYEISGTFTEVGSRSMIKFGWLVTDAEST